MILGITTAPRENGVSYLGGLLESIERESLGDVYVRAEPGSDLRETYRCSRVSVCKNYSKLGNHHNFGILAGDLLGIAKVTNEKVIITCEDDVVFSRGSKEFIDRAMSEFVDAEDFGFLSLYTSSIYQNLIPTGVHYHKAKSLWGACALAWTPRSLAAVIEHRDFSEWRGLESNPPSKGSPEICHVDTCIGNILIKLGLKTYFCSPCVAQHVGEVSSLRKVKLLPERQALSVF